MATETELYTILRAALLKGFATLNTTVQVKQAAQPTQQGVPTQPVVFMNLVTNHRYGCRSTEDKWVDPVPPETDGKMVHTETQIYETMFQLSALSVLDPDNLSQKTALDLLNEAAYIMQSVATLQDLRAQNIGIERVMDVRSPNFSDDRDRFESSPSLDLVLTHKQIVTTETDVLQSTELKIYPI